MILGRTKKQGIAKVKRIAAVLTDDHRAGNPALLEKPDREKIFPRLLQLTGRTRDNPDNKI